MQGRGPERRHCVARGLSVTLDTLVDNVLQLRTPEIVPDATIIVTASTRGLRHTTRLISWSPRAELAKCQSDGYALTITGLRDIFPFMLWTLCCEPHDDGNRPVGPHGYLMDWTQLAGPGAYTP